MALASANEYTSTTQDPEPQITLILPSRNEKDNVLPMLDAIEAGVPFPVVVHYVDDSSDGTPEAIRAAAPTGWIGRHRVLVTHRPPGERQGGLGGAVVLGFNKTTTPYALVMDCDLQHPVDAVERIFEEAERTGADVVIGSRYVPGGSASRFGLLRRFISKATGAAARAAFPYQAGMVRDPMSGMFLVRLAALDLENFRADGFKVLLALLVQHPGLRVREVPIEFGTREAGQSKAGLQEGLAFFRLLFNLLRPVEIESSLREIDYAKLLRLGVMHLVFDVDNTLVRRELSELDAETVAFLQSLVATERFRSVTLATNSARSLEQMAESIGAELFQPHGRMRKPSARYYRQIIVALGCRPHEVAFVDDKLLHVLGAMRAGLRGIQVHPLGGQKLIDRLVRRYQLEQRLIRRWNKSGHAA